MSPPVADSTKDEEKKQSQRRINKPLIEKRRRARINECLAQLKTIVLEATEKQSPRPSKLEKADILEMTVDYIKSKQSNSEASVGARTGDESNTNGYTAGYTKCLNEIAQFLEQTRSVDENTRRDIIDHVTGKIQHCDSPVPDIKTTEIKLPIKDSPQQQQQQQQQQAIRSGTSHDDMYPLDLRVNKRESETTKSTQGRQSLQPNNGFTGSNYVTAQSPMGLISGAPVFLLVQLPTSQSCMTSQQTTPPEVSNGGLNLNTHGAIFPTMISANGFASPQMVGLHANSSSPEKCDNPAIPGVFPLSLYQSRATNMADKMVVSGNPSWQLVTNPNSDSNSVQDTKTNECVESV